MVVVALTVWPGVAVTGLNAESIASTETGTVVVQAGSALPAAQLLPAAAEVMRVARLLLPVSGLCTVTVNVTVAESPGARSPVQVSDELAYEVVPVLAAASPL